MTGERRDVLALIQLMDVLVLTSITEGLPNVLLEAAASGVPIVTSAAGGASEVVVDGETGFVVPCRDSRSVADRVLELIRERSLRRKFIDAARRRVRAMFTADRFAAAVQACYMEQQSSICPQEAAREITRVAAEQTPD